MAVHDGTRAGRRTIRRARARRRSRVLVPLVVTTALVAFLFVGVFPTRSLLAQRTDIAEAEARLETLRSANVALDERAEALRTDAEVERLAREQYGLVRPGEEAYAILPPPPAPLPVPDAWPFGALAAAATTPAGPLDEARPAPEVGGAAVDPAADE